MYARLLQGYEAMDSELQLASASASRQLRLMVSLRKEKIIRYLHNYKHFIYRIQ